MITPQEASEALRQLAEGSYGSQEGLSIPQLFDVASIQFSSAKLAEWRKQVIELGGAYCWMCGDARNLEAHHIYPKSLYPDSAYIVANGVMLCFRCHRVIVHGSNTFDLTTWQKFVPLWSDKQ